MEQYIYNGCVPCRVRSTRFAKLGFTCLDHAYWRFVDRESNQVIGPHYASKDELLADIVRFAASRWNEYSDESAVQS